MTIDEKRNLLLSIYKKMEEEFTKHGIENKSVWSIKDDYIYLNDRQMTPLIHVGNIYYDYKWYNHHKIELSFTIHTDGSLYISIEINDANTHHININKPNNVLNKNLHLKVLTRLFNDNYYQKILLKFYKIRESLYYQGHIKRPIDDYTDSYVINDEGDLEHGLHIKLYKKFRIEISI